jgi:hypothetical protein
MPEFDYKQFYSWVSDSLYQHKRVLIVSSSANIKAEILGKNSQLQGSTLGFSAIFANFQQKNWRVSQKPML